MELMVLRPSGAQLFPVAWVELTTQTGSFMVQHQHVPMIVSLMPGSTIVFMVTSGKFESIAVQQCIVEITREKVIVFMNE